MNRSWTSTVGASVMLAAAVLAVYWPVRSCDFVSLDDPAYFADNAYVRQGLTWDGARWAFTTFQKSHWHPLTWLSLMLDAQLFGTGPGGPHLVNVILHAGNAVLLLLILRWSTGALWPSAMVAALFALHPLRVESVAWVSERKDVLSGLFWMTTLLAYSWYVRRRTAARYLLVLVSLALGLMAKSMLVTLPAVLLLLDVWPFNRWRIPAGAREGNVKRDLGRVAPPEPLRRLVLEKLPLFGLSLAFSVVTVLSGQGGGAVAGLAHVPWWPRLTSALLAYVGYLRKTIWPTDLAVFYPHPAFVSIEAASAMTWPALAAAPLLVGISLCVVAAIRRRPHLAVGWFWYLGTLLPVIGIVQIGFQAMADRYAYLPLVGIYIAIAWGGRDIALRWPRVRPAVAGAAVVALLLCAVTTRQQVQTWRNSVTLFEHALAVIPDNYFAHGNLAAVLTAMGRTDEAVGHYEQALRIHPKYTTALTGLGTIYFRQGRLDEAEALQRRALEVEPDSAVVLVNLGAVLFKQGKLDEAGLRLERALSIEPNYPMAHTNLGAIYAGQGKLDQAAMHFEEALRLQPGSAAAHTNLGIVLVQQGRLSEAAAHFEQALRIQPDLASARQQLQAIRARLGRGE